MYQTQVLRTLLVALVISLTHTGFAQSCGWDTLALGALDRTESRAVVYQEKIYIFGGWTDVLKASDYVESYDAATDTWDSLAPMPVDVTQYGIARYQDQVWLVGGFIGDNPGPATTDVQIYNITTNSWSTGPSIPAPRGSQTAAFYGRKLHTFGGLLPDRMTDVDEHWVLDLDDLAAGWQPAAPMLVARNHHTAQAFRGQIYSIGGQFGLDGPDSNVTNVEIYDPVADVWTALNDLPDPRSHFESSTFTLDGSIYVLGGRSDDNFYTDLLQYDPVADSWTSICTMPTKLHAPVGKYINEELILSGGGQFGPSNPRDDTYSTTLSTTPDYSMGLYPMDLSATQFEGDSSDLSSVLYTLRQDANFSVDTAGLPAWLSVVAFSGIASVSGEEIDLVLDATGLAPGVYTHSLTITAPGYSSTTLPVTLTVVSPCDQAIGGLNSTVLSPTSATLSWNAVPTALGYRIQGRPVSSGTFRSVIVFSNSITIPVLDPSTTYVWKVQSRCTDLVVTPESALDTLTTPDLRLEGKAVSQLYPNPASTQVRIDFSQEIQTLEVYNTAGQLIDQANVEGASYFELDVRDWRAGLYILHLEGEVSSTQTFTVE